MQMGLGGAIHVVNRADEEARKDMRPGPPAHIIITFSCVDVLVEHGDTCER